ncbi:MAG: transglycosylase SLT domain-containing protein [Methylococcales bacterium]|nr:transglycosylase SLT domain-containing protein [Methylococcales bacterium]
MMPVKLNRHVNLLVMLMTLAATGCSQNNKDALTVNEFAPDQNNAYVDRYFQNYQPINKAELNKTAQSHKDTVWERLLSLYSLPKIEHERIDREVSWYLNHPQALSTIQQRAEPYLHLILDEVEAKNIPGELALLPVVESAFQPNASSRVEASGLWQFMPGTGRMFGLQQNSWYDGRRDVYASTKAATTYLKQLGETFDGDWLLALASYNWGKGNVRKSIERNEGHNLPTDYWSLRMPEETANYVPKLLAIAKIFANADDYNVNLHHIPNKPYFEVVNLDSQLSLNKAAEMANMSLHDFLKLNPAFNKSKTAPEGAGPRRLLIPVAKAESFKENLAQLPFEEWVNEGFNADEDESTAVYLDAKPAVKHEQHIKTVAKAEPKQSVKALLTAKKPDKNDNKKSAKVAANSRNDEKGKTIKIPNHVAELAKKVSEKNKNLTDKNKTPAKAEKSTAKPVTVAVVTKNIASKKPKHG